MVGDDFFEAAASASAAPMKLDGSGAAAAVAGAAAVPRRTNVEDSTTHTACTAFLPVVSGAVSEGRAAGAGKSVSNSGRSCTSGTWPQLAPKVFPNVPLLPRASSREVAGIMPARLSVRNGRRRLPCVVLLALAGALLGRGGALEKRSVGSGLGAARPDETTMVQVFWRRRRGCVTTSSLLSPCVGEALRLVPTWCGALLSSGAVGGWLLGYSLHSLPCNGIVQCCSGRQSLWYCCVHGGRLFDRRCDAYVQKECALI